MCLVNVIERKKSEPTLGVAPVVEPAGIPRVPVLVIGAVVDVAGVAAAGIPRVPVAGAVVTGLAVAGLVAAGIPRVPVAGVAGDGLTAAGTPRVVEVLEATGVVAEALLLAIGLMVADVFVVWLLDVVLLMMVDWCVWNEVGCCS